MDSKIIKGQASIAYASTSWDFKKESEGARLEWFDVFLKLPKVIKYGMISLEAESAILNLAKKYSICNPEKVGEISRICRDVFVKKIKKEEVEKRVVEKLEVKVDKKNEFLNELKKVIVLVKAVGKKELAKEVDFLPLIPALKKYEELRKFELGYVYIKLEDSSNFVKPSVKNWLEDYIQKKGAQTHGNLERSDYLYNTENPKKLKTKDRAKLLKILESYDRDTPLYILKEEKEFLFEDAFLKVEDFKSKQKVKKEQFKKTNKMQNGEGAKSKKLGNVLNLKKINK